MNIIYRVHAVKRMFERDVSKECVEDVLLNGEIIENYPEDKPYPSFLILGFCGERAVHIVFSKDGEPGPVSVKLYNKLRAIQYGDEPDPYGWVTVLE